MKRRVAIVGYGKLGKCCIEAMSAQDQVELAGVVRRSLDTPVPAGLADVPVADNIGQLDDVHAALICVPTEQTLGVCTEVLQQQVPVVECASLHGEAFDAHLSEIDRVATWQRVPAVVGAGWDPGALSIIRGLFALLTPKGHTDVSWRPGISVHHTTVAGAIAGVQRALATEHRVASGKIQRFVYVELAPDADPAEVELAIQRDPLYVDEETVVIPVDSVARLEEQGHGVLVQRRGTSGSAAHQLLLLEGRYSDTALAAVVMVAAIHALEHADPGARSLFELPLGALWGRLHGRERQQWI